MTKWRNEKAFVSWLGLSPNNRISGQRVLSSRTRKVVNRAATILRLAAMILGKTNTPLGSFYRRKRAQLGGPKAVTATARKLGCLIYRLIKNGQGYNEPDMHTYELKYKDQILNSLRKRANTFGFDLVELPKATSNLKFQKRTTGRSSKPASSYFRRYEDTNLTEAKLLGCLRQVLIIEASAANLITDQQKVERTFG